MAPRAGRHRRRGRRPGTAGARQTRFRGTGRRAVDRPARKARPGRRAEGAVQLECPWECAGPTAVRPSSRGPARSPAACAARSCARRLGRRLPSRSAPSRDGRCRHRAAQRARPEPQRPGGRTMLRRSRCDSSIGAVAEIAAAELEATVPAGRWVERLAVLVAQSDVVVRGPLLGVAQRFVGLGHLLESGLGIGLLADIRVVLARQLAVSALDLVARSPCASHPAWRSSP